MFGFWRGALVILFGVFTAVIAAFGISAEQAKAPSETQPARIQTANQQATSSAPAAVSTTTTTAVEKPKIETPKPAAPKKADPAPVSLIQTPVAPLGAAQASTTASLTLNERVRSAVVNILCITESGGPLNSISGSGVIIDPRGIILTNAHVAQYFLLKNYPVSNFVECTVRTGSPAEPKYKAELVFLPPAWIAKNAQKINDEKPMGNGEHDYAFLRITGPVSTSVAMPASFPYLQISVDPPALGDSSLIAAYPAGFLGGVAIQRDLYQASSLATVGELFTFATSTIDLFSIGGSIVAQQGSSGGASADRGGILIGVIVTSTDAPDTGSRDLRALATSYIVRDFQNQYGTSLATFLGSDVAAEGLQFRANTAPSLIDQLVSAVEHPIH